MPELPILITERLKLRPFALSDAPQARRLAGAFEVADTTLTIPHPYPEGAAEAWIATHRGEFEGGEGLQLAVTQRGDGALLGAVGLEILREHARASLGYWIGKPYWGRGYATEAAKAVVTHAFSGLGLNRVEARHFVRNPASGRVLQKAGFLLEGILSQYVRRPGSSRFEDEAMYAILERGKRPGS